MTRRTVLLLALALALPRAAATAAVGAPGPASARICGFLGDRLRGRLDVDTFTLEGAQGETLRVTLVEEPDARNAGAAVRLRVPSGLRRAAVPAPGALAGAAGELPRDGTFRIAVRQVAALAGRFRGEYCLAVSSSGSAASTLAATSDVEVEWVALDAADSSLFPPFVRHDHGEWGGLVQPVVPLLGGRVYGVILTNGVKGLDGKPLSAAPFFRTLKGTEEALGDGPAALFSPDPEDEANPYPEARLARGDGSIHIPDRVALRGLDPLDPTVAAARAYLRAAADEIEPMGGFSTVSPIEIALSQHADLATVTPENLLVFERTDGRLDLDGLLAEARRHGVRRRDVALAISFPTQPIENDLRDIRTHLLALEGGSAFAAILDDPDPTDDLAIGVFGPTDPSPYQSYLAANPQVAKVVGGLLPSREFRDARGFFDPQKYSGAVPPATNRIDFVLTIPAGFSPPYRTVVFQHGFGGSDLDVLDQGAFLADRGFAVIGISAVSHGRRGSFFSLLSSTPRQLCDIFRQTNADQMALVRMLETGVDIDGDGRPDLDPTNPEYLGISLGGLMGGPFVAVEDHIHTAALVVMSGRFALNGQSPTTRSIYEGTLAAQVGLTVGTPEFETFRARDLELGQHATNPADALNFARRWDLEPFAGAAPRRILMQEGIGDTLVFNVLTEELAHVAGFSSNVPQQDPAGISGHWIFQPPGGHNISARPDVRTQSAVFLDGDGTEIIDPDAP